MKSLQYLGIALGLSSLGCNATETGNPPAQGVVSLGLTAFSSTPETAALGAAQGGLLIDRLVVNLSSLSLIPCSADSAPIKVEPASFDLVGERHQQQVSGDVELCSVRLEFGPRPSATDVVPAGTAIYIHGQRTDGSPFEVVSTSTALFDLNASSSSTFGTKPLLLAFDMGAWFTNVDVHNAHAEAGGIARLDNALNPAILAAFEARTTLSVALYVDQDGDGVLDEGERTPVAVHP